MATLKSPPGLVAASSLQSAAEQNCRQGWRQKPLRGCSAALMCGKDNEAHRPTSVLQAVTIMKEEEAQRKAEAAAERKRRKEEQVQWAQAHALPAPSPATNSRAMHGTAGLVQSHIVFHG